MGTTEILVRVLGFLQLLADCLPIACQYLLPQFSAMRSGQILQRQLSLPVLTTVSPLLHHSFTPVVSRQLHHCNVANSSPLPLPLRLLSYCSATAQPLLSAASSRRPTPTGRLGPPILRRAEPGKFHSDGPLDIQVLSGWRPLSFLFSGR